MGDAIPDMANDHHRAPRKSICLLTTLPKIRDAAHRLAVAIRSHRLGLDAYVGGQGWRGVFRVLALARLNYAASGG